MNIEHLRDKFDLNELELALVKYLEDNQLQDCNYLVVDDSYDAGYGHTDNFFRVNPQVGFNETHLTDCITFFEGIINNAN